jgi:hypothetical protein
MVSNNTALPEDNVDADLKVLEKRLKLLLEEMPNGNKFSNVLENNLNFLTETAIGFDYITTKLKNIGVITINKDFEMCNNKLKSLLIMEALIDSYGLETYKKLIMEKFILKLF